MSGNEINLTDADLERIVMQEFADLESRGTMIRRDCEVTLARQVAERLRQTYERTFEPPPIGTHIKITYFTRMWLKLNMVNNWLQMLTYPERIEITSLRWNP